MRKRAERQEETRARIVDATIALHTELGPARTTISAIAERAGVERLTVYRHFPDEASIFDACSSTFLERNPLPVVSQWDTHRDPRERTRHALEIIYAYYRTTQQLWSSVLADQNRVPSLEPSLKDFAAHLETVRDDLVAAWKPGRATRRELRALVSHAIEFTSWRSLERTGLGDRAKADLMTTCCEAIVSQAR